MKKLGYVLLLTFMAFIAVSHLTLSLWAFKDGHYGKLLVCVWVVWMLSLLAVDIGRDFNKHLKAK